MRLKLCDNLCGSYCRVTNKECNRVGDAIFHCPVLHMQEAREKMRPQPPIRRPMRGDKIGINPGINLNLKPTIFIYPTL